MIIEIRYKLRCLGLQIEQSSTLVGDNQSVILNTTSLIEVYLQYTFSSIQATCCSTYVDLSVHQVHQDISNISLFYITRCSMGNDEKKHLSRRLQISLTN